MKIVTAVVFAVGLLATSCKAPKTETQIVAHRGYWRSEGSYENTLSSLRSAVENGLYAVEFDINLTADHRVVVCHGPRTGEVEDLRKVDFDSLRRSVLPNGEPIPTLDEYLDAAEGKPIRWLGEKNQLDADLGREAVRLALEAVSARNMQQQTEYISFSLPVCLAIRRLLPDAMVSYLGGDLTPDDIRAVGLSGLDYNRHVLDTHPEWVARAHRLGQTVNVWTVDDMADVERFTRLGVDFVTTNRPVEARAVVELME